MENKTMKKSADINAPAEKVWDVLVNDDLNRQWYAIFSEGTYADTDWKQGSRVNFLDGSSMGITGVLTEVKTNELIVINYDGMVNNGKVDSESEVGKEMAGAHEIYRISGGNGVTHLEVELMMIEKYIDMMDEPWDEAMKKIKELAEN